MITLGVGYSVSSVILIGISLINLGPVLIGVVAPRYGGHSVDEHEPGLKCKATPKQDGDRGCRALVVAKPQSG